MGTYSVLWQPRFDLDGSGLITRAELRKAVEMMHTFAASKKESKRRVVTNAAGQLVVVAAEISDTLIAAELDAPASAPADAPGGGV